MSKRTLLIAQLKNAWNDTIKNCYEHQLINSEHALQVYFCSALLEKIKDSKQTRRLFVEPKMWFNDRSVRRHPDVVVCNSQKIVGVIELKYVARGRPKYEGDLETLQRSADRSHQISLSNERYRGEREGEVKGYELAEDSVFCWAGVYTGKHINMLAELPDGIMRDNFLQLSALTSKGCPPVIVQSTQRGGVRPRQPSTKR